MFKKRVHFRLKRRPFRACKFSPIPKYTRANSEPSKRVFRPAKICQHCDIICQQVVHICEKSALNRFIRRKLRTTVLVLFVGRYGQRKVTLPTTDSYRLRVVSDNRVDRNLRAYTENRLVCFICKITDNRKKLKILHSKNTTFFYIINAYYNKKKEPK